MFFMKSIFFKSTFFTLVLGLTLSIHAFGETPKESDTVMNGIQLKDYEHFDRDWKMISVRYRKDTNEMRFVYANDKAWSVLQKGAIDYPDGAIFAKIGAAGTEDPKFKSSLVPHGAVRYQFMIKDKKKFADTGGWGYGLFDANGKLFPGKISDQSFACYACHKIVPERGQVFSQPMKLSPFTATEPIFAAGTSQIETTPFNFKKIAVKELPEKAKILFPKEFKEIYLIEGDLRKYLFDGTLQEIIPTLMDQWRKTKIPTALFSEDFTRYSLLFGLETNDVCKLTRENGKDAMILVTTFLSEQLPVQQDVHKICVSDKVNKK